MDTVLAAAMASAAVAAMAAGADPMAAEATIIGAAVAADIIAEGTTIAAAVADITAADSGSDTTARLTPRPGTMVRIITAALATAVPQAIMTAGVISTTIRAATDPGAGH
ncbi:exported hypothetical protein [Candidatus Sulfopaludibacter sp. SbA6]|nr:exported hypothetical protein [Candidatus Sulfopaludibacter sp. SbA6]